jgi:electron transport complex protein RnfC
MSRKKAMPNEFATESQRAAQAVDALHHASDPSNWPRSAPAFETLGTAWPIAGDFGALGALASINPAEMASWIDRFRRAGVAADRRTSPDFFAQFTQAARRPIDTVLCSVLDVDPGACLNSAIASRYPLELVAGVTIAGRLTQARRAAAITDVRVPSGWFTTLRKAASAAGIRVDPIINDYPQADPTLMLYTMLGRRLRPGRLPTERGVFLIDAAAAVAMGRYALHDEPMVQTPMVLRDHTVNVSFYRLVPVGMTLAEVCERVGIEWRNRVQRAGDLLRDVKILPDAIVGAGELIFHTSLPSPNINPSPCIRCGWCVDACPTRVQPAAVLEACQRGDVDLAERAGIEACIECGVCSYVCPSQRPLLEGIRKMRELERDLRMAPAV